PFARRHVLRMRRYGGRGMAPQGTRNRPDAASDRCCASPRHPHDDFNGRRRKPPNARAGRRVGFCPESRPTGSDTGDLSADALTRPGAQTLFLATVAPSGPLFVDTIVDTIVDTASWIP